VQPARTPARFHQPQNQPKFLGCVNDHRGRRVKDQVRLGKEEGKRARKRVSCTADVDRLRRARGCCLLAETLIGVWAAEDAVQSMVVVEVCDTPHLRQDGTNVEHPDSG